MTASPAHCHMDMKGKKRANTKEEAMEKTAPPMLPSHDFLGEMRSNRRCLPIKEPTQYAPVSLSQINTKMESGRIGL